METIDVIESQPTFPGGLDSLKIFFKTNLRYPTDLHGCEGVVFVGFVVTEDGSITDTEIVKSPCKRLDKLALDLFQKMPKWIPAMENDKPIRRRMIFPLKFGLM
jgi:protein TonB